SLHHKIITVAVSFGLLVGSLSLVGFLNVSMFGDSNLGIIQTSLKMPKGTPLEATAEATQRIQNVFQKEPGVDYIETTIGDNDASNRSSMFI
ncbi:efflux RND transporter permease subunit, partial [Acinetobacter baumannii]|uniref:efflux RND transporter permease subunit n=1 Tax=Acinetobacter baumannii TaxID=470 RepID=UPI000AEF729D